jgi:hypothetical protein
LNDEPLKLSAKEQTYLVPSALRYVVEPQLLGFTRDADGNAADAGSATTNGPTNKADMAIHRAM